MALRKSWLIGSPVDGEGAPTEATATAQDGRVVHAGLYARDASGVVRAGVLGNPGVIVSDRSDMALDIDVFTAVLTRGSGDGAVPIANDGLVSVGEEDGFPAAPSSGSRWVRVYAIQHDDVDHADTDNEPVFGVVAGAAAADPTLPALPAGAMPIARIKQPANVLATADCEVTEDFPMTAASGGIVPVRNSTERGLWTPADNAFCVQLDTDVVYERVGGAWVPVAGPVTTGTIGYSAGVSAASSVDFLIKDHKGMVFVHYDGTYTVGSGFIDGTTIGTLPAGFRPAANYLISAGRNGVGAPGACAVIITSSGQINVYQSPGNNQIAFDAAFFAA